MQDKSIGYRIFTVFNYIFMLFIIFVTAYPVYYVIAASFSDPGALSRHIGLLWAPLKPYSLGAYELVFENRQIINGFINTFTILILGLPINLACTMLGAFFLSVKGPMLKNAVAMMIVFTMYFGGGLVPSYLNIRDLGMLDTTWALVIPSAITTSNLIIMKSSLQSIPSSLIESARLDGASYLQVLVKIMVPLSKATLAVMVLYYGVSHWNSWFSASIYLRASDKYPLQLILRNILDTLNTNAQIGGVGTDEAAQVAELMKYALIVVTTAPILVLYPFLQKYFVKGVMIGAVKG